MGETAISQGSPPSTPSDGRAKTPHVRSAVAGVLMGLANLVPGVSGGTMILVMGLYDEFIAGVADVTRLRFEKRRITFLAIVGCGAVVAIGTMAGTMSRAVTLHPIAMFSLFVGMTLGGAPLLIKLIDRFTLGSLAGVVAGLSIMVAVATTRQEPPDKEALRQAVAQGTFVVEPAYARDTLAGITGMSAMVLPGVSGAYMMLIIGRYESILAAVSMAKTYVVTAGNKGDPAVFMRVLVPTALGALFSVVLLSNVLKWLLQRHRAPTLGLLLGILLGSVVGIWPFDSTCDPGQYALGAILAVAGFAATLVLSRISA